MDVIREEGKEDATRSSEVGEKNASLDV